ncbi:glycoside hydrolase family 1 protein [Dongshaea marina]|uniref:glycoside hydrolase family 1 protein n=1 Tax=Dongshaea marina TaxID=2047966 RepID=UPI000D3E6F7C|nr:glycoside hydrolase family 1 protein [Dongshaea marina]
MKHQFPEGFWWGSAASATQFEGAASEGGKGPNIWDHWFSQQPNRFFNGVGPEVTSDFYHRMETDIELMQATGHNSFRTSISWSRLFPDGGNEVNPEAVDFYHKMLDKLDAAGIEPFINLYHFDMPMALQEQGGWESREVVKQFSRYARFCFEEFGSKVNHWFTFNEPVVPVEMGYLYDAHYPNVVDFKRAVQVGFHTMLAHAGAVSEFRASEAQGKIGIILNLTPSYPRSQHPADLRAAEVADLLFNRSFLDPAVKGEYPQALVELLREHELLPECQGDDLSLIACQRIDLLGVNYYFPRRVKARESLPNPEAPMLPEFFFDHYEMPGRKINPHRGWEIYEKGIYDCLVNIRDNYGNIDTYISENGMGVENEERFIRDGEVDDQYRIDFIKDHLRWVHRAIDEGCHCRGYHLWTFIDNWSWCNAYKNRYGLVRLDLKTQQRTIKQSGHWFRELALNNGFDG